MSTHVEIETKYDLSREQALPDLAGVGTVDAVVPSAALVLTATYFDTPSQALAAAGATLRRRTGGTDDGWHLKLPLQGGRRLEVHRDLGRGQAPPPNLLSLVRAVVRGEPVRPVATMVNHRTVLSAVDDAGKVLAELADDNVTGERHDISAPLVTWRELEIELVDGDEELLSALDAAVRGAGVEPAAGPSKVGRVLGSPPPPSADQRVHRRKDPVESVLSAATADALRVLTAADPLLRLDRPDAAAGVLGAVHRLRATAALLAQIGSATDTEKLRSELIWLESMVAELAGIDAVRPLVRDALVEQPRELVIGPVARRLTREVTASRRMALAGAREALDSSRYLGVLDVLRHAAETPVPKTSMGKAGDVLPDLLVRAARRAERRLSDLVRTTDADKREVQLPGARRAVERAQEAGRLAGSTGGHGNARMTETLEMLDRAAGLLANMETSGQAQRLLLAAAIQAHAAGENGFTLGRLHGLEQMRTAAVRRQLLTVRKQIRRLRKG